MLNRDRPSKTVERRTDRRLRVRLVDSPIAADATGQVVSDKYVEENPDVAQTMLTHSGQDGNSHIVPVAVPERGPRTDWTAVRGDGEHAFEEEFEYDDDDVDVEDEDELDEDDDYEEDDVEDEDEEDDADDDEDDDEDAWEIVDDDEDEDEDDDGFEFDDDEEDWGDDDWGEDDDDI